MKRLLALVAVAGLAAGCRESVEARLIYYPSHEVTEDPSSVGLAFPDTTIPCWGLPAQVLVRASPPVAPKYAIPLSRMRIEANVITQP